MAKVIALPDEVVISRIHTEDTKLGLIEILKIYMA
jgi:hypothetical protein